MHDSITLSTGSVTLDPHSACSNLVISQEKTSLTLKDGCVYGNNNTCSVLGREGITSGRCYWEVEVGNEGRGIWALGVCGEDANRSYGIRKSPENGFWVMEWWVDKFYACTTTRLLITVWQFPHRVAVFLDYDNGYVSFCNLTDGSHIFSYSSISFTGTLFPYFMLMSGNMSLTLCSSSCGLKELPLPLNNSSCNGSSTSPGKGLSLGSGAECASPG